MPAKVLYDLALRFRKEALWERLSDDELFAVPLPGGDVAYCCVMGLLGEHLSLAVYPGEAGLSTYRALTEQKERTSTREQKEMMFSQDCVMVSFEAKGDIPPRSLMEIDGYGLKPRGKRAYPLIQRMRPGFCPWYVQSPSEEAVLESALRAGLEVSRRLGKNGWRQVGLLDGPGDEDSRAALGFTAGPAYGRSIPLITENKDGTFIWSTTPLPEPIAPVYPSPALEEELLIARLRRVKRVGTWACVQLMFPEPVAEGEPDEEGAVIDPQSAPYFPMMLLTMDQAEGMVMTHGLVKPGDDAPQALVKALTDVVTTHGRPGKILVPDMRTQALLSTAMAQVGVEVQRSDDLPELDEAVESFYDAFTDGKGTSETELAELLDRMAVVIESGEMPDVLREQLRLLYEQNMLPEHLLDKVGDMLNIRPAKKAIIQPMVKVDALSFVISVSLGKGCYRHIQIDAENTLEALHEAIIGAFDFNNDHLHAFFMDNRMWSTADSYVSEWAESAERPTSSYSLRQAGLRPGMAFKYVFDFGADWMFQCKVLRVVEAGVGAPKILRSVGDAPAQYPEVEDEDEGEESLDLCPEVYSDKKLKALYAELPVSPEVQKLIHQYFDAFSNLYAVLSLRKALEIYNEQNAPISEEDFAAFAEIVRHEQHLYRILGADDLYDEDAPDDPLDREIIAEHLLAIDDNEYKEIKEMQRGIPYYLPEKDVLLRYADDAYYEETPAFLALRGFLRRRLKLDAEQAQMIADEMQLLAIMGEGDYNYIVKEASRIGAPLQEQGQVMDFLSCYVDMANASRLPALGGHTPNELEAFEKTGRNDPCPCGSGKKYKKCCGRQS